MASYAWMKECSMKMQSHRLLKRRHHLHPTIYDHMSLDAKQQTSRTANILSGKFIFFVNIYLIQQLTRLIRTLQIARILTVQLSYRRIQRNLFTAVSYRIKITIIYTVLFYNFIRYLVKWQAMINCSILKLSFYPLRTQRANGYSASVLSNTSYILNKLAYIEQVILSFRCHNIPPRSL